MHYTGENLRNVALPLGGLGTGTVALAGNGALRHWQLHNLGNHEGHVPDSFFALRLSRVEPPLDELRLLQGPPLEPSQTPLVTDDVVPPAEVALHTAPTPGRATVTATYPSARVDYDTDLPLDVSMEVSPLVPLTRLRAPSRWPRSPSRSTTTKTSPSTASSPAALQNSVGWDGVTPSTT